MVCRTHKYADGGKVTKDHLAPAPKKPVPPRPKVPVNKGTTVKDVLQGRKKQMEDLGL